MKRYSKAQLNAISRSYTQKNQEEATDYLKSIGIDFQQYCKRFGYNGSPVTLAKNIRSGAQKTAKNVEEYRKWVLA